MPARDLIRALRLQPHPEGGWYREFYRSGMRVNGPAGERCALTGIYYLLERGQVSRWHTVQADETWSYYGGAPLELITYDPRTQQPARRVLGGVGAHEPAAVVPADVWQAAISCGEYSLVSCLVAPGFEFEDFRFVAALPDHDVHFAHHLKDLAHLL